MRILLVGAILGVLAAGCASGGGPGAAAPRTNRDVLTAEEIAAAGVRNAYEAVSRLRPGWLTHSGTTGRAHTIRVIVDDTPYMDPSGDAPEGSAAALRSIQASEVLEIRFLSADEATTRFGTGYTAGALLVRTLRGGR